MWQRAEDVVGGRILGHIYMFALHPKKNRDNLNYWVPQPFDGRKSPLIVLKQLNRHMQINNDY